MRSGSVDYDPDHRTAGFRMKDLGPGERQHEHWYTEPWARSMAVVPIKDVR
jgi:hypothetical protein